MLRALLLFFVLLLLSCGFFSSDSIPLEGVHNLDSSLQDSLHRVHKPPPVRELENSNSNKKLDLDGPHFDPDYFGSTKNTTCNDSSDCKGFLICKHHQCRTCEKDSDCDDIGYEQACKEDPNEGNLCKHKSLLPSISPRDIGLSFALFVTGAIAAGGGIGGGGIFVPLLILITAFTPKEAVSLSNTLIGGAAIANYIQMAPARHPFADRPLIDYNLALFLQPLSLGGTMIGVLFNTMFPTWLILALLILMLFFTLYRTTKKGIQLWKKETSFRYSRLTNVNSYEGSFSSPPSSPSANSMDNFSEDMDRNVLQRRQELQSILQRERSTPWKTVAVLFGILTFVTLVSLFKGSSKGPSIVGIHPCSIGYWLLIFLPLLLLLLFTVALGVAFVRRDYRKSILDYPFKPGDVRWKGAKTTIQIAIVSFLSGVLASLLGIGGGMILSPVMLELGILPEITAATSSFMILFTSLSSVAQFLVAGNLEYDYSIWFCVLGLVASFVGQTVLNHVVRRYRKKSYIIFTIAFVIAASTVLLGITGTLRIQSEIQEKRPMGFQPLCS